MALEVYLNQRGPDQGNRVLLREGRRGMDVEGMDKRELGGFAESDEM
jgi:hypothetical protein